MLEGYGIAQAEIFNAILSDMKYADKPIVVRRLIDEIGLYVDAFPKQIAKDFYSAVLRVYLRVAPTGQRVSFLETMMELEAAGSKDLKMWQDWFGAAEKKHYAYEKAATNLKNQYLKGATIKETEAWLQRIRVSDFTVDMQEEIVGFVGLLTNLAMDGTQDANPDNILERAWKAGVREPEPTGFDALNRDWNGGWRPKSLMVIGMPSGTGKTSSSCSFTAERARQNRYSLYNSFEQPSEELLFIMLSNLANLTLDQVEKPDGRINSQEEWDSLQSARELLKKYVRIYDTQCKLEELPMRVRRHQAEFGPLLDWMAVDQISTMDTVGKSQSAAEWSRDMEKIAYYAKNNVCKPYGICSVLYSQVPDDVKKQLDATNHTNIDRLRGSSGVKNASDVFVIGGRHNGKVQGATGLTFDSRYASATVFQTTKARRDGRNGYAVLRFDAAHHRLLNETLPSDL